VIQSATLVPAPADPLDSSDLVARAQAGDSDSFWALCAPHQDRLVRQAFALCRHETLARELAQECVTEAWRSIRRFNGRCRFATWLTSILLHRHQSALRRTRWRAFLGSASTPEAQKAVAELPDVSPTPDQTAELSERSRLILRTLDRLPAGQRNVAFLRFYADQSLEEIAAALECSVGTVKSRLFHALENLRRMRVVNEELR